MNDKPTKLEFAPGCFDNLDMTQEELDAFKDEIQRLFDSGELFENSVPVDFDEMPDDVIEQINASMDPSVRARKLN